MTAQAVLSRDPSCTDQRNSCRSGRRANGVYIGPTNLNKEALLALPPNVYTFVYNFDRDVYPDLVR